MNFKQWEFILANLQQFSATKSRISLSSLKIEEILQLLNRGCTAKKRENEKTKTDRIACAWLYVYLWAWWLCQRAQRAADHRFHHGFVRVCSRHCIFLTINMHGSICILGRVGRTQFHRLSLHPPTKRPLSHSFSTPIEQTLTQSFSIVAKPARKRDKRLLCDKCDGAMERRQRTK